MNYNIITERLVSSLEEVYDNLKNGEFKLIYFDNEKNTVNQVGKFPIGEQIEIITIQNDEVIDETVAPFPFSSVDEMKYCGSKPFSSADGWFIGYIKD